MVQIGDTEWDDELLFDRVDLFRKSRRQDVSGVDRRDPETPGSDPERTALPCSIQDNRGRTDRGTTAQVQSDTLICFAEDLSLRPDDILMGRPPSVDGITYRVIQANWGQTGDLKVYFAWCNRRT